MTGWVQVEDALDLVKQVQDVRDGVQRGVGYGQHHQARTSKGRLRYEPEELSMAVVANQARCLRRTHRQSTRPL